MKVVCCIPKIVYFVTCWTMYFSPLSWYLISVFYSQNKGGKCLYWSEGVMSCECTNWGLSGASTCPFAGPVGNWVGHLIGRKICGSVHTRREFPHRAGMLGGQLGREVRAGRHLSSSQSASCSPYTSDFTLYKHTHVARTLSYRQNVLHAGSWCWFSFRPCCTAVNFTSRDKPQSGIMTEPSIENEQIQFQLNK